MRLEGPVTQVARSQQTVYAAVNDVEKYKDYMPSGRIFVRYGRRLRYALVFLYHRGDARDQDGAQRSRTFFPGGVCYADGGKISLEVRIEALSDKQSSVQVAIEADVNPMLRMMVERPLRRFLEDLSEKIGQVK